MKKAIPVTKTSSGIVFSGSCELTGLLLGTDGVNDPTITVYDNTAASGTIAIPTITYDASILGPNGVMFGFSVKCSKGIYIEITTAGLVNATIYHSV